MPNRFCKHLDDYAALFVGAEASYAQCVNLVDRIVETGPGKGLAELLLDAVQNWEAETIRLRTTFETLASEGRIKLPTRKGKKPLCPTCKRRVPRLAFPEWDIVGDGPIRFRGENLLGVETSPEDVAETIGV